MMDIDKNLIGKPPNVAQVINGELIERANNRKPFEMSVNTESMQIKKEISRLKLEREAYRRAALLNEVKAENFERLFKHYKQKYENLYRKFVLEGN